MTTYPWRWPLEWSYEKPMWVIPYVIVNYTKNEISHTACIPSTPFFQSSSPPPPPPSPSSPSTPSPLLKSPALGILLFDRSSTKSCNFLLPAKHNPPLPACSHRSHFHPYQRSPINRYQLVPSKARSTASSEATFTPTSEGRSTANSLLPPKSETWEWAFHH